MISWRTVANGWLAVRLLASEKPFPYKISFELPVARPRSAINGASRSMSYYSKRGYGVAGLGSTKGTSNLNVPCMRLVPLVQSTRVEGASKMSL